MLIEAMKQALEAFDAPTLSNKFEERMKRRKACDSLRQAIEQAEKQEPVAWGMVKDGEIYDCITPAEHDREQGEYIVPLYAAPQQREWVGLTDHDIHQLRQQGAHSVSDKEFRMIEAKLKEKNYVS